MPLRIFTSSAGSGKTYTLSKMYLELALREPMNFTQILGVTFTNKATEEMKSRILSLLNELAEDKNPELSASLQNTLNISKASLAGQANLLYRRMLHAYHLFAIVTIDSFFHQVIRVFARELGIQNTFRIDLDTEKILDLVIDQMLVDIDKASNKPLRDWLTSFAMDKLMRGQHWDFKADLLRLSKEMLKDDYLLHKGRLSDIKAPRSFFQSFKGKVEEPLEMARKHAQSGINQINAIGGIDLLKSKERGPAGLFQKVYAGDFTITENRKKASGQISAWLVKKADEDKNLVEQVKTKLWPHYDYLIRENENVQTALSVKRFFYAFGILAEISKELEKYRQENDVLLISDLTDFLRQIIRDSDTPYVYEKIGARYQHFLIDEFQDTSMLQWNNFSPLVANSLASGKENLVVGDVKQSIYRWRGGDWRLLNHGLQNEFDEVSQEQLDKNWRSAPAIVNFNNFIFSEVPNQALQRFAAVSSQDWFTKALKAYSVEGVKQVAQWTKLDGLVDLQWLEGKEWKALSLQDLVKAIEGYQAKGFALRDMAILTRTAREGREVAEYLLRYKDSAAAKPGVRYDVVSSEALYLQSSAAIRLIVSFMKSLFNPNDLIARAEWINEYIRLSDHAIQNAFHYLDSWQNILPQAIRQEIDIAHQFNLYELVEWIIRGFKLNQLDHAYSYLLGFQDAVLDYSKTEKGDVANFLIWWEDIRKERAIKVSDDNDAIRILTIHKAKGLEYPLVFIPFLNWKLDHDGLLENILWCTPPKNHTWLGELPVVPIRYSSDLDQTVWSVIYWQEKYSAYMDAINLLYVAFTRPKLGLWVRGPGQEAPIKEASHVGDWLWLIVKDRSEWDSSTQKFVLGKAGEPEKYKAVKGEVSLGTYTSATWRERLQVKMPLDNQDPRRLGIKWHDELSVVREWTDASVSDELLDFLQLPHVRPYFENLDECFREAPLLLPDGQAFRVDRLIRKADRWILIDFKSGKQKAAHKSQIRKYMAALNEMGYQSLEGVLLYIPSGERVLL